MFFQIYIPSGNGQISVNLADPVVILGAGLFALHHIGKGWPVWRVPGTGIWVAAASAVIPVVDVRGWLSFGWTDWAFINKGLGWLVLLCYGATGALIIRRAHESRSGVAVEDVCRERRGDCADRPRHCAVPARIGHYRRRGFVDPRLSGLSQNANAFAFMLVLVLAGVLVLRDAFCGQRGTDGGGAGRRLVHGLPGGALGGARRFRHGTDDGRGVRPMLAATLAAAAFIAGAAILQWLLSWMGVSVSIRSGAGSIVAVLGRTDAVTMQHLQTIQDGLAMFLAHPIFGAGLGAYVDEQIRSTGMPLDNSFDARVAIG